MNLYNRLNKLCVSISDEHKFLQWAEGLTVRWVAVPLDETLFQNNSTCIHDMHIYIYYIYIYISVDCSLCMRIVDFFQSYYSGIA